jgi:hypothetical protein
MVCVMLLNFKTVSYTKTYNCQYSSMFIYFCCCEMKEIANEQKEGRRELKKANIKKRVDIFFFFFFFTWLWMNIQQYQQQEE